MRRADAARTSWAPALTLALALASLTAAAPAPPGAASATGHDSTAARGGAVAHESTAARATPPPPSPTVSVAGDTSLGAGPRLPGTTLRLGEGYARARLRAGFAPAESPDAAPDELVLAAPVRFFGVDGKARVTFAPGGLSRFTWKTQPVSPHQRDYIEDQLRRAGYRRECQRLESDHRECDWVGTLTVHVRSDSSAMTAEIVGAGAVARRDVHLPTAEDRTRAAFDARLAPLLADPAPILGDTLTLDPAAAPGRRSPPMLLQSVPPTYDDALRARGISGIVPVLALVGLDGRVVFTRAEDGPKELRGIAMQNVAQYRFGGYIEAGKKVRFWVWIPVRFGV